VLHRKETTLWIFVRPVIFFCFIGTITVEPWSMPSGVPRRHSGRRLEPHGYAALRRDESRRGTQECVRHV
jgi:hypothetical protein